MKHSIKLGLFIGVTVASFTALVLRFVPPNYWTLVILLYLSPVVGTLTAYFVHKDLSKRMKTKIEKSLDNI